MPDTGYITDALAALAREMVDLDGRAGAGLMPAIAAMLEEDGRRSPYLEALLDYATEVWLVCSCGEDTREEPFVLKPEVWEEAYDAMPPRNPCVSCFEDELGRDLTPEDFADDPVNAEPRSARLRQRLGLL